jgi:hypothetical protein
VTTPENRSVVIVTGWVPTAGPALMSELQAVFDKHGFRLVADVVRELDNQHVEPRHLMRWSPDERTWDGTYDSQMDIVNWSGGRIGGWHGDEGSPDGTARNYLLVASTGQHVEAGDTICRDLDGSYIVRRAGS